MPHAVDETVVLFRCKGEDLLGIIASSADPAPVGVLVVVGGPQYRVGSHRQFVQLARDLAASGTACMRFDYRGMGDGGGATRPFDEIDADVRVAVDTFFAACPRVTSIVLWGLCDGASAICFYAATDPRITGVVLVNPWVRTQVGEARTYLRHYYVRRFFSRAFWRKLVGGEVNLRQTVRSLLVALTQAFGGHHTGPADQARVRRRLRPAASRADGAGVRALPRARAGDPERQRLYGEGVLPGSRQFPVLGPRPQERRNDRALRRRPYLFYRSVEGLDRGKNCDVALRPVVGPSAIGVERATTLRMRDSATCRGLAATSTRHKM